jgi:hypothetical protein
VKITHLGVSQERNKFLFTNNLENIKENLQKREKDFQMTKMIILPRLGLRIILYLNTFFEHNPQVSTGLISN